MWPFRKRSKPLLSLPHNGLVAGSQGLARDSFLGLAELPRTVPINVTVSSGKKELRVKAKGVGEEVQATDRFVEVVAVIVGMNLLFSIDSILTVVGMTDIYVVMAASVVVSVALMLAFADPIARFMRENPDFEILGLFVLLLIGFVLFLEGGHVAGVTVNGSEFPYIPQWITIFILLLMFSVDFYQNWLERKREKAPVELRRRKK